MKTFSLKFCGIFLHEEKNPNYRVCGATTGLIKKNI
jgi:hypothetical protein